ncbi:hypothetical protein [Bradyrhizobium guangdongense]|uniref:hypothetical protein n=1 Tax=Bradyrhizobium guangdongense TaxID=1325090 RepID=UPI00131A347F|nr:hypothetical protein [Bradyrhizobium guangdongense]
MAGRCACSHRCPPGSWPGRASTRAKVVKDLGEDEDWLWDIANEMEIEDGVIWVYGVGEDGVQAFTDFGIDNLIELIKLYKENPELLRR